MHGQSSHLYNSIAMHFSFCEGSASFFRLFASFWVYSIIFLCFLLVVSKKNVYICNIFVYKSECTRYEVCGSLFIYS